MMFFIKSKDHKLWDIVEDGPFVPQRSKAEWSVDDRKKIELNCKALHILFCAFSLNIYQKMSSCEDANEVCDKREVTYEGTNKVKETKIGLLNLEYENFTMDPDEDIKRMFERFSTIVNQLKNFGEEISEDKLIRKVVYSLSESRDSKKTTIIEAKDLKKLKLDELIGSLLTHEMMSLPLKNEKEKKIKKQGIDVNVVTLKSSKCNHVDTSEEEDEEEEIVHLFKKCAPFMKKAMKEFERESMKKKKRANTSSHKKKAYVATWSDEDSIDDEQANLCLMDIEED
ncbi:hypothetical protein HRI_005148400 [Hibiscus trionum]|uniref:UBN2 domain-containing protein n=1 Tax=Hibiscus trionum TaxID=183268 RepID=A0A9W7JKA0_HIBTR|nr:hypothetical protein HRI_005148400 [Hibiscus trionum]